MSQNRRKKAPGKNAQRRKAASRPLGGGGLAPGYQDEERTDQKSNQSRARRASTVIAVVMLVAIVIPVVVGACFYQPGTAGAAGYAWSKAVASNQSNQPVNLSYSNARFLRRDSAETAPTASVPAPTTPASDNQFYIGESGHNLANGFLSYWRSKGGQNLFGNPVSEEFQQDGRTVQLFERALFEYHPEAKNTPAEVQLGFLGRQLAEQRGLQFNPAATPATPGSDVTYFTETAHSLGGLFKAFWDKNNGLYLLGFPISEELGEDSTTVQYFERGRLELLKEGQTQKAILSAAGDLLIEAKGWQRPTKLSLELDIEDSEIWQGRTLAIRLLGEGWQAQKLQGTVGKDAVRFVQASPSQAYKAFQAFAPNLAPGSYPLNIQFYDPAERLRQISRPVQVTKFNFALQRLDIPDDKTDLLNAAADEADNRILAPVYSTFNPLIRWAGKWGWPTTGPITTEFGQRRIYNDRPEDPNYYHAGLDIAQGEGVPVYAPAAGKVIYTGFLKVHGNAIAVDHGTGVISFYYHLSGIVAKTGQEVKAGEVLGRVGTTGRSNGPHLHWEVRVNGIPTDPRTFQKLDLSY